MRGGPPRDGGWLHGAALTVGMPVPRKEFRWIAAQIHPVPSCPTTKTQGSSSACHPLVICLLSAWFLICSLSLRYVHVHLCSSVFSCHSSFLSVSVFHIVCRFPDARWFIPRSSGKKVSSKAGGRGEDDRTEPNHHTSTWADYDRVDVQMVLEVRCWSGVLVRQ